MRRQAARASIAGVSILVVAACGGRVEGDGTGGPRDGASEDGTFSPVGRLVGGCDLNMPELHYCAEYYGAVDPATLADVCARSMRGVWSSAGCSKPQRIGGCTLTSSGVQAITWFYRGSPLDAAAVAKVCADTGQTFVSP